MPTTIKTNDATLLKYFDSLRAIIPDYQRSYEWKKDQVETFMDDLMYEVDHSNLDSRYFFGPVVTTESKDDSDIKEIIDGQQRLTTSTIVVSVIRNYLSIFSNSDAEKIRGVITEKLIGDGDPDYNPFRLTQNNGIHNDFKNKIQTDNLDKKDQPFSYFLGPNSKGKTSNNRLLKAYNLILNRIKLETSNYSSDDEKVKRIKKIFDMFTKTFFIVEIWTPKRSDAFQIFQTINARGLELSASDLIKSDFFGNSGDYSENVKNKWLKMQNNLNGNDASDYIRYVWNAAHEFSIKRYLYKNVSHYISKTDDVEGTINHFMNILYDLSLPYAEIKENNNYDFLTTIYRSDENSLKDKELRNNIKNILNQLETLKFKTYYPIYLAMIKNNYSLDSIYKIMKFVFGTLLKNMLANNGTNWLEKFFASEALKLNSSNNFEKTVSDMINDFKLQQIEKLDNQKIKSSLIGFNFKNKRNLLRFILTSVESYIDQKLHSEKVLNSDHVKVQLEHIMPQNPKDNNGKFDYRQWGVNQDNFQSYLWRLGNITLLSSKPNKDASNSPFNIKKEYYNKSDVKITQNITNYDSWGPEEID